MKRDNSAKGFSLVEVMVALVILLIGMLGIMGMQYYAVSGNANSRELRMATNLGQDMIETLKSTAYDNLATNADIPTSNVWISGGLNFNRSWWVVPNCIALTVAGANNLCPNVPAICTVAGVLTAPVSAVRARVCWTDKAGGNHAVTLDSVRWNENAFF